MTNQVILISISQIALLSQMNFAIYVIPRMEYEERNRKKEAKEIAVLEVMEKMKEAEHQ